MSAGLINSIVAVVVLAGLALLLYRPKVQESGTYKATVVPLAEIMAVGFIVFSPVIILLFGYGATWAMLGLCLLGILTGGRDLLQHQQLRAADRRARSAAQVELHRAVGARALPLHRRLLLRSATSGTIGTTRP